MATLRVVLIKPSKYGVDGCVERFKKGFMPNATLYHVASMTPPKVGRTNIEIHIIDEYVWTNLDYLELLKKEIGYETLVALVGVQSHQFHRAIDIAAYALDRGVKHCVIGGSHPMTCDTSLLHESGVSFALAEAELIWSSILEDALKGKLQPVYGSEQRWEHNLGGIVISPPSPSELSKYWIPMLGLYPVRGCPYNCNFCSVVKISGHQIRSSSIDTTLQSLRLAKEAGVEMIMFVSDNFNKYPEAGTLLEAMIDEELDLKFFCQCDTQIIKQPDLFELLGRANCFEMFVGIESLDRAVLKSANKFHNYPSRYKEIADTCYEYGIRSHFSNMIGFPDDDENSIRKHLDSLKNIKPTVASFYVVTPIPGTDQYDDYMEKGLISEDNLDRFDATFSTWEHPKLSGNDLMRLLYWCYKNYYGWLLKEFELTEIDKKFAIFNLYSAIQKIHPMSGGVDRVRLDTNKDYLSLRQYRYGYETLPLPKSLKLTEKDSIFNSSAKIRRKAV